MGKLAMFLKGHRDPEVPEGAWDWPQLAEFVMRTLGLVAVDPALAAAVREARQAEERDLVAPTTAYGRACEALAAAVLEQQVTS